MIPLPSGTRKSLKDEEKIIKTFKIISKTNKCKLKKV